MYTVLFKEARAFHPRIPLYILCNFTSLVFFLSSLSPQNDNEAWAVGGGGSLWYSTDGGETFKFSSGATNIGANLYDVKFFGGDKGFAIGSDGVLLK